MNLVKHLVRRSEAQRGDEKLRSLSRIAEVYETQLTDDTEAVRRYKDVLALDAHHPEALRNLDLERRAPRDVVQPCQFAFRFDVEAHNAGGQRLAHVVARLAHADVE